MVVARKININVKIAIDLVELKRQIVRKTRQMQIFAELRHQISVKSSEGRATPLFLSTIDLKYAFAQISQQRKTAKDGVAGIV